MITKKNLMSLTVLLMASLACNLAVGVAPTANPQPIETVSSTQPPQIHAEREAMTSPTTFDSSRLGTIEKDVTYCTMDGIALKMDIYYPSSSQSPFLVTMYVHGGGWSAGDKAKGAGALEIPALQSAGFLVVAINYRLAPENPFPAMIEDAKCAVRYLRAHADEYNMDPNRIGVWGGSAGGHLVNLLGTTDESAGFDVGEYLAQSSRVQAVVDMFGPTDLTVQFEGGYEGASRVFAGFDAALASPVTYVTPDDPPFLLFHGDSDPLVPIEQSRILLAALQAAGVPAELVIVENAGHGFKPEEGKTISPSRQEIAQRVVEFFEEQLK